MTLADFSTAVFERGDGMIVGDDGELATVMRNVFGAEEHASCMSKLADMRMDATLGASSSTRLAASPA